MVNSPSKYTSLERLKQIRKDNYIGEGGKEYCAFEVETMINEKECKKAIELENAADKYEEDQAKRNEGNKTNILTSFSFIKEMKAYILENNFYDLESSKKI